MNKFILRACIVALTFVTACDTTPAGDISQQDLLVRIETDRAPLILDVRTEAEFSDAHIPGAINMPHTEIDNRLAELPADKSAEIVVHCKSGRRAEMAFDELTAAGYQNVRLLEGHFDAWSDQNQPMAHGVTR